ncbi:MAG: hypothetical protein PUP46_09130 [Endozoicomonas sp. (ex Botrylloides leachii)]|nr:hypothetical protein [Endozoicomonas sp. (ex Botrylloides leachii)]
MINTLKKFTLAVVASAVASTAVAATNPAAPTGGSSQGDFDITLNKEDLIIINNFENMYLAQFIENGPNGDYLGSQELCIGRAGASVESELGYAITASNAKANFILNNGNDDTVPANNIGYKVYFADKSLGVQQFAQGIELVHSMQNMNDFNTDMAETGCVPGTNNSTVWVKADGGQVANAAPGVFTDTVTVTVAVK